MSRFQAMIVHRASSLSVGSLLSVCTDYFVRLFRSSCLSLQTLLTICTDPLDYLYGISCLSVQTLVIVYKDFLSVCTNHFVCLCRPFCLSNRTLLSAVQTFLSVCTGSLFYMSMLFFSKESLFFVYATSNLSVRILFSICTELFCLSVPKFCVCTEQLVCLP